MCDTCAARNAHDVLLYLSIYLSIYLYIQVETYSSVHQLVSTVRAYIRDIRNPTIPNKPSQKRLLKLCRHIDIKSSRDNPSNPSFPSNSEKASTGAVDVVKVIYI